MALFDKTFPTLDCAACILTPKMVQVGQHPNIVLLSLSEVERVDGYVGNFVVRVRKRARYVDEETCTGCGECWNTCIRRRVPRKLTIRLGGRRVNVENGRRVRGVRPDRPAKEISLLEEEEKDVSGRELIAAGVEEE